MIITRYDDKEIEDPAIPIAELCRYLLTQHDIDESDLTEFINQLDKDGNSFLTVGIAPKQAIELCLHAFVNHINKLYKLDIEFDPDYLEVEVSE